MLVTCILKVNDSFKISLLSRHVCDVMCWVKRSEFSCCRTVLQYCCCLIAILTAWKMFMEISRRNDSTRVKNYRDVMRLPAHDVTVIILATFKMCYENFHSVKLLHSAYLSQYFDIKCPYFLLPMFFKDNLGIPFIHECCLCVQISSCHTGFHYGQ